MKMKRVEIDRRLERISSFVNKAMIAVAHDITAVALTGVPVDITWLNVR